MARHSRISFARAVVSQVHDGGGVHFFEMVLDLGHDGDERCHFAFDDIDQSSAGLGPFAHSSSCLDGGTGDVADGVGHGCSCWWRSGCFIWFIDLCALI